jgi:hypothetical protein
MKRKLATLLATALAGGVIALGAASPASADHCTEIFSTDDPIIIFSCQVVDAAPDLKPTVAYYSDLAFDTVHLVYCTASPNC